MSTVLSNEQIAALAKEGGRLSSEKQWVLADALAGLSETQIQRIATMSGRSESTLLQYARAAQRWPEANRVDGVSFSAHRVALSWVDPVELLTDLKHKHGSPTVRQVREAMGLEGHPAIEHLEKGVKKLDGKVSLKAVKIIQRQLDSWVTIVEAEEPTDVEPEPPYRNPKLDQAWPDGEGPPDPVREEEPTPEEVTEYLEIEAKEEASEPVLVDGTKKAKWTPPVSTSDATGI